jgi:hypothetical protein
LLACHLARLGLCVVGDVGGVRLSLSRVVGRHVGEALGFLTKVLADFVQFVGDTIDRRVA